MDITSLIRPETKYVLKNDKLFFSEVPNNAKMHDESKKYIRDFSVQRKTAIEYFKRILEREDHTKVFCDVGIGTNRYEELTRLFHKKIGIDFVPYSGVNIVADLTKPLPLKDSSVDIVFLTEVLEHIPNPELLISEIYRILKPSGYCLGSVPFLHPIHSAPYDFHRYTNFALDTLFRENNFKDIEIKNIGTPFEVYKSFHNRFFNVYAMRHPNIFIRTLFRFSRKLHHLLLGVCSRFYKSLPEQDDFVLAYYFKAKK